MVASGKNPLELAVLLCLLVAFPLCTHSLGSSSFPVRTSVLLELILP